MSKEEKPNKEINVGKMFQIDSGITVMGFTDKAERVPEIDESYKFDKTTTLAILAGFFAALT